MKLARKIFVSRAGQLLIAAIVSAVIGVLAARHNNVVMVELRNEVIAADQSNGDVEGALARLREHVYGHMNTDLTSGSNPIKPPIQLKGRYDRLMAVESERIKQQNAKVAADGEALCAARYPAGGFNAPRVACIQDYVSQNAASTDSIPEELYKFDFASPAWTPDLAGLSLVLSGFFFIGSLLSFGYSQFKHYLP